MRPADQVAEPDAPSQTSERELKMLEHIPSELSDIKASARRVLEEVFPADDEEQLAQLIDNEFVNHEAPPETPPGVAGISYFMHMLAQAFSDQRWRINQILAENDTVAIHCTHSGQHTGFYLGLPPTGRHFSYRQMHMIRMVNGKAVEHWAVRDVGALMRQLTADPVATSGQASQKQGTQELKRSPPPATQATSFSPGERPK